MTTSFLTSRSARDVGAAWLVLASVAGMAAAAPSAASAPFGAAARPAPCGPTSTDPADFSRAVPMPLSDYTVRGFIRGDCLEVLHLAIEVDSLRPDRRHLVRRLRAQSFTGVTWRSRMAEVRTADGYEQREEFVIRASGRGLRVRIELSWVGVAPRWSGTESVLYTVRPLR